VKQFEIMNQLIVAVLFLMISIADIGAQEKNSGHVTNNNSIYVFTSASNVSGGRIGAGYYFTKRISLEAAIGGALQYEGRQPVIVSSALNYHFNNKTSIINSLCLVVSYGKYNSQIIQKKLSISPTISSTFRIYNNLKLFYRFGYFTSINHYKYSGIHFDAGLQYYLI
jgi:hypothetical protein